MLPGECTLSVFCFLNFVVVCLCVCFRVGVHFFYFRVGFCLGVGLYFVEGHCRKRQLHNIILHHYLYDCNITRFLFFIFLNRTTDTSLDIYITSDSSLKKMCGCY